MAAAVIAVFLVSEIRGQDESSFDPVALFYQYLDLDGQLSEQGLPIEGRKALTKERDQIRDLLLANAEASKEAFVEEYSARKARGGKTFQGELMTFSRHTGLAKTEFAEFARDAILETDLSEPREPLLTTAIEYLGEHGVESDLEIMARLDDHVNPTYAKIRDRFAERLKQRLANGNAAVAELVTNSTEPRTVPNQIVENESVVQNGEAGKSSLSSRALVVIVVAVFGILLLFIRAFFRDRAS